MLYRSSSDLYFLKVLVLQNIPLQMCTSVTKDINVLGTQKTEAM